MPRRPPDLTCGVALPVFAGEFLIAVVVFFCGDDEARVGAIELWTNGPDEAHFMSLADGYYGAAEMFEFNSRYTKFSRGYGLPGRVWKKEMPMVVKDLFNSRSFLRWEEAIQIGVNRGLGIPYRLASGQVWVVTFLSALDTPIARRFEIWVPNGERDGLVFDAGDCDTQSDLVAEYAGKTIAKGEGAIGEIWRSGIPAISDHIADEPSASGQSARAAGMTSIVALPFIDGGSLKAVAVWYL